MTVLIIGDSGFLGTHLCGGREPADYTLITDPANAERALDDIAPVYESAFTEPPCNEGPGDLALILETYQREHKTPGFRLVLARSASGELAGSPAKRASARSSYRNSPFSPASAGSKLHTDLLSGITAERTTLTVRPEAPAAAWYECLGYTAAGHTQPWNGAPVSAPWSSRWEPETPPQRPGRAQTLSGLTGEFIRGTRAGHR
ncbi:hypothetical protein [Streptomyces goshikiensis]|uniref:hypothetical protein n=1 Tax=Streptomyces goshikiensis TaxID=1942 RepID=UPI00365647EE